MARGRASSGGVNQFLAIDGPGPSLSPLTLVNSVSQPLSCSRAEAQHFTRGEGAEHNLAALVGRAEPLAGVAQAEERFEVHARRGIAAS